MILHVTIFIRSMNFSQFVDYNQPAYISSAVEAFNHKRYV